MLLVFLILLYLLYGLKTFQVEEQFYVLVMHVMKCSIYMNGDNTYMYYKE